MNMNFQLEPLSKTKVFLAFDWRRVSIGVSWNRTFSDFKIIFPFISIVIWLKVT